MFLGLGAPSPSIEETYRPLFALDFWKRSGRFYEISPKNQREFLSQLCEISYRPVPVRFPASIDLPPDSSSLFLLSMDCRFTLWVVLTMKLPTDRKSFSLSRLSSTSLSQEDKEVIAQEARFMMKKIWIFARFLGLTLGVRTQDSAPTSSSFPAMCAVLSSDAWATSRVAGHVFFSSIPGLSLFF